MRITKTARVYLVAKTALNTGGVKEFLSCEGLAWPTEPIASYPEKMPPEHPTHAEQLIELAGRCCYMSFGNKAGSKSNAKYLDNLLGRKADGTFMEGPAHGSVLEHASFTFIVTGAGRGWSHEQVRHRAGWAYSQLSTRYCDFEREPEEGTWDPGFSLAPLHLLDDGVAKTISNTFIAMRTLYKRTVAELEEVLLDRKLKLLHKTDGTPATVDDLDRNAKRDVRKAARGAARDILPIGTEAIMTMSANARAIWNTIYLRGNEHAEAQIREVYVQIAKIMEREMPTLFRGLTYYKAWDDTWCVRMPRENL